MNINSINSQQISAGQLLSGINTGQAQHGNSIKGNFPPINGDKTDISPFGQIMSKIINELGEGKDGDVKAFFDNVFSSIKNGTFDAAALAEEAPDELKSFLEEQGIDLEEFLTDLNSKISERELMRGMRGMGEMSLMDKIKNQDENGGIKAFFDSVFSSVQNGTFDTAALADKAPDELKSILESEGVDLEEFLTDMSDRISEREQMTENRRMEEMHLMEKIKNQDENSEIKTFFDSILSSVRNGTFDAEASAKEVPETLLSLLESEGINILDFLNNMSSRISERIAFGNTEE